MKIYKYPLVIEDYQTIEVPVGAVFLDVQFQRGQLCLWALIDETAPRRNQVIGIVGTGNLMGDERRAYIGTVQDTQRALVWHVFEVFP